MIFLLWLSERLENRVSVEKINGVDKKGLTDPVGVAIISLVMQRIAVTQGLERADHLRWFGMCAYPSFGNPQA
jgi:hypothetical protein